ncbi:O-antigen polymerase [Senegalimassilia anaerobia]|uniref:Oligosaccharide repeat unit polymerase n=1 Tax=Senegalimassilia anaerobia TaxID=1473216 RepID=A0A369LD44_9ACTN|nr:O-antigen polymerase [Senegalimassilia anaerobia]RDB57553.1 hypothetical protein C1880_01685 [Senegalimassilia anaerobia]
MNLLILAFFLLVLLISAYLLHDLDAITPSVLFCLGFFLCAAFAMSNAASWRYEASETVIFTVVLGVALFLFVSWVVHLVMSKRHGEIEGSRAWVVPVNRPVLLAFLALQLIVFVWTLRAISQMYPAGDPLTSISLYDQANKFSDKGAEAFPFPLGPLRGLCTSVGYYVCYLLGQSFGMGRDGKEKPLLALNLAVSMLVSFEGGGRTTAVSFVIYCFIALLMVKRQWRATRTTISFKTFLVVLAVFVFVIATFQTMLGLMGRSSGTNYWDYICMYIGAEIPNLDYYLTGSHSPADIFGCMTLYTSINWIGAHFGIPDLVYQLDLPFRYMNSIIMGNVYTTFYAFVYDFGWWGIPALTAIMAFVSQWVYEHAIRFDAGRHSCIWVILYALAANTLIMSFFSNKFFEAFLCIGLVRNLLFLACVHILNLLVSGALKRRNAMHEDSLPLGRED